MPFVRKLLYLGMANFDAAYNKTSKNEGGYANDPDDRGGETYKGIARNYWPKWGGWKAIDEIKSRYGKSAAVINKFAGADASIQANVKQFYAVNFWYVLNLQLITDQQLAQNVYDFGVNAGTGRAGKFLQQAANALGAKLVVDGDVGNGTVSAVNKLSGQAVYNSFNNQREAFYRKQAIAPNQSKFLKSWLSRIEPYRIG